MGSTELVTGPYLPYSNIIAFMFSVSPPLPPRRYFIIDIPKRFRTSQWEIVLHDFYKWHNLLNYEFLIKKIKVAKRGGL